MVKVNGTVLRNVVICLFMIWLFTGLIFQANDAYARVSLSELLARIEALEAENAAQQAEINVLKGKLASVSVDDNNVYFEGVNVHIRSGKGYTLNRDGFGNLIHRGVDRAHGGFNVLNRGYGFGNQTLGFLGMMGILLGHGSHFLQGSRGFL